MVSKWIEGAERLDNERIAYAAANNLSPRVGSPYRTAAPWRKVWHTTEVRPTTLAGARTMAVRHRTPPHLWAWPEMDWVGQTVPLDLAAYALRHEAGDPETNHAHAIQTEVIGFARDDMLADPDVAAWLGRRVLGPILAADVPLNVLRVAPSDGPDAAGLTGSVRQSWSWWADWNGQCAHQNVPGNSHWDAGRANYLAIAVAARPPEPTPTPDEELPEMFLYKGPGPAYFFCHAGHSVGINEASDLATFQAAGVPVLRLDDDTFAKFRAAFPGS